jgi:hypothetical protein
METITVSETLDTFFELTELVVQGGFAAMKLRVQSFGDILSLENDVS